MLPHDGVNSAAAAGRAARLRLWAWRSFIGGGSTNGALGRYDFPADVGVKNRVAPSG